MDFDDDAVGAGRYGGQTHGRNQAELSRPVGGVHDYGKMGQFLEGRNSTEIQRVPRISFKGA